MWKRKLILFLFLPIPLTLTAQSVGLVLSGGGSKGLAHIGVIKALEENRIPIDYIAGTSMGAIIGGCYAAGLSTDEIIEIVRSEEFSAWMSGTIQDEYRYYFKEEDPGPDIISLGIDWKDTIPRTRIPLSVIPSHLMDFAFMEIYSRASAAAGYNFDSLFVPFLCNAADISNSKEVVFRDGDLAQACRASMTVPLYFRPIIIDGKIMYDGGIYNNFPLTHLEEAFQPDIVIGSKASMGNTVPDEFDILGQVENIVMKPAVYEVDSTRGVLLDMDLGKQSLLAFDMLDQFVEVGYQVTMDHMERIKALVRRRGPDLMQMQKRREQFKGRLPEWHFNEFEFEGLSTEQQRYVEGSLRKSDSVMDIKALRKEYLKLAGDKSLSYIYPQALYKPLEDRFKLRMRVIPMTPLEARLGLFFSTSGMAQTYLGFSYREISEISMNLNGSIQFGRYYNGANLGIRFDYPNRIPLYIQMNFNYNGYRYNNFGSRFIFEDLEPSYITEDEINFRFDAGIPYRINGVIKGGIGIGRNREVYYMNQNFTSTDTSEVSRTNALSLYAASDRNTLDDKQFATKGYRRVHSIRVGYGLESYFPGRTSENELNEKKNYTWISGSFRNEGYLPLRPSFSLGYLLQAELTLKPLLSNYYSTIIEAPVFAPNMVSKGLFLEQYRAHQYFAVGLMPVYHFMKPVHAKMEAYAFFPAQKILRDDDNTAYMGNYFKEMHTMFHASLNFVSVAGPISIHLGYLSKEEKPWLIQISFGYLLFNKKSVDV